MPTEHPIIFSTEMVRAILDCRKTQTRRIIKPQPISTEMCPAVVMMDVHSPSGLSWHSDMYGTNYLKCIYGKVGDTLWVRETWLLNGSGNTLRIQYKASDSEYRPDDKKWCGRLVSKHAPEHINEAQSMWDRHNEKIKGHKIPWRSPRFMPKWAARIFLEITNIRVERLQDISEDDILAEGIEGFGWDYVESSDGTGDKFMYWNDPKQDMPNWCPRNTTSCECIEDVFSWLWDSINAKRGFGWDKNPWVRVIEFKKVD